MISTVRRRLALFLPLLVTGLLAGCGGGGGGAAPSDPGGGVDVAPPDVAAVSVPDGAANVAVDTVIQVTFSEEVRNVSAATFQLRAGASPVEGTVTLNGNTATFTPSAALAYATSYTAIVTTGVADLANNALAADHTWSFTTCFPPGAAPPGVTVLAATSIAANGAVLNGIVTSNGLPTECWFEFGTDPTLGACDNTARLAVDSAAASRSVAEPVTGLASGTVYHFRMCASNSLGTVRSGIVEFTTPACLDCHGGIDGGQPAVNGAPVVTRYWQTSGHGRPGFGLPLVCDDCHDVGTREGDHATDGSGIFNTLSWPGKPDNTATTDTAHLRDFFFPVSPLSAADYADAFDTACAKRAGCHVRADGSALAPPMNHAKSDADDPDELMEFGTHGTPADPKAYSWYAQNAYPEDFYKSQSAWVVRDLTTAATGTSQYGTCVSCHDPHGTGTTDRNQAGSNVMVRGNWMTESSQFCGGPCHQ